jgi:hypothetical protein
MSDLYAVRQVKIGEPDERLRAANSIIADDGRRIAKMHAAIMAALTAPGVLMPPDIIIQLHESVKP